MKVQNKEGDHFFLPLCFSNFPISLLFLNSITPNLVLPDFVFPNFCNRNILVLNFSIYELFYILFYISEVFYIVKLFNTLKNV